MGGHGAGETVIQPLSVFVGKMCRVRFLPLLLCACVIGALIPSLAGATDSYTVNNGAALDINEFSTCKKITNNHASGNSIMVPTKTNAEWQSFYNNKPAGVTEGACSGGGGSPGSEGLYSWGSGLLGNGTFWSTEAEPLQISANTTWTAGALGDAHSCAIDAGKMYCWGAGGNGKLGLGSTSDAQSPTQAGVSTGWTDVAAGFSHTCGIDAGKLYCWGSNAGGRTGLGTTTGDTLTPTQIGSATTWTDIAVRDASCGIEGGKLYCWGVGYTSSPVQQGAATDWSSIVVGGTVSCGIRSGGLYCWGGAYGGSAAAPIHEGTATDWSVISSNTGSNRLYGIRSGALYYWVGGSGSPTQVGTDTDWTDVSIGNNNAFGIRGGQLYKTIDTTPTQVGTFTNWSKIYTSNATFFMGIVSGGGASACVTDGGTEVGGGCWYMGGDAESCTTVCSSHGGYNAITRNYAGDLGSQANCDNVLTALGAPAPGTITSGGTYGDGCSHRTTYRKWEGGATTEAAGGSGRYRACACNLPTTDITTTLRSVSTSTVDNTVYNHTGINIGTAAADRLVIVIAGGLRSGTARSISSINIGGTDGTIVAQQNGTGSGALAIAYRLVPTGTTTDVIVTYSGTMDRAGIVAYTITGQASNTPTDTFNVSGNGNVSSTIDVLAGGTAFGGYYGQDVASVVWSGINEDNDFVIESSDQMSTAYKAFTAAQTNLSVGVTVGGTEDLLVGASWR